VPGQRDQVRFDRQIHPAKTLHRVAEQQRARPMRHFRDLCDRLDDTNLVIDQHRPNQRGLLTQTCFQFFQIDQPLAIDRKQSRFESLRLIPERRVTHGSMFCVDNGDLIAPLPGSGRPHRQIDRFGCAARKDHPPVVRQ